MQTEGLGTSRTRAGMHFDEDCLYLNIWMPAEASTTTKRPVLVRVVQTVSSLQAAADRCAARLNRAMPAARFSFTSTAEPSSLAAAPFQATTPQGWRTR